MKLSNQNICNLHGCKMPLGGGGVQIISMGCATPPPRKSMPEPFLMGAYESFAVIIYL
jgi:hypothetical protein